MAEETAGTQVGSGSFHQLGEAVGFRLIVGKQPDSLIFQASISHPELDEPYTIEFFALPDKAMALLQMLAAAAQRENYPMPVGAIEQQNIQ
jgi:hypothetical protein